ncbi:MAG: aminoglycoside phosphotransferase, partial [Alphaproteobacteria bacterium]|nr:aminoglycoside phosphotransferase [Alphaproteobacteria bacterium]
MAADPQGEVVAFLARAETYGVTGPVERLSTHISHVFLAGARAYKLKRAVRFSYLDFATPARRRAACVRELTVNRRTAPSLYVGLAPVARGADGALRLGAVRED